MTTHRTGTREEWLAARTELLASEKELTRRSDELAVCLPSLRRAAKRMVEKPPKFDPYGILKALDRMGEFLASRKAA